MTKLEQLKLDREQAIKRVMDQYSAMETTLLNSIENRYAITFVEKENDIVINISDNGKHVRQFTIYNKNYSVASKYNTILYGILSHIADNHKDASYSDDEVYVKGSIITLASLIKATNKVSTYTSAEYIIMNKAIFNADFAEEVANIIPKELNTLVYYYAAKELM